MVAPNSSPLTVVKAGSSDAAQALKLNPRSVPALVNLADLCRERGLNLAGLLVTDIVTQGSLLLVQGDADLLDLLLDWAPEEAANATRQATGSRRREAA